ncbi:MAG: protein kinase domain-containing protein, partial [Nocardioidaceae bacterium]
GTQVCSALAAAHAAGIVHRDIKPGNVLVRPDGRVKVTDFGIAQTKGQAALTGTGAVLGTAHYLSPEQASGLGATAASDLYSVGVLLFQALTGTVPFTDDSPVAVALSHIREEIPSVRDLAPDVPAALAAVVATATAKDPLQRFSDARQMEAALSDALTAPPQASSTAVLPVGAAADGRPDGLARRRAAAPRAWLLGGTGALLAGALALAWMTLSGDPSSSEAGTTPAQPSERRVQVTGQPASPSPRTSSPRPSPEQTADGPVVPADAAGSDAKELEEDLKDRGYDVEKADIESSAPKDSVVATIPGPGQPLASGQTVVLVVSKGEASDESTRYVVPDGIVGSDAKEAEKLLKDQDLEVKTVDVDSARPKDTVVATYPAPGADADAGTVVLAVSKGR